MSARMRLNGWFAIIACALGLGLMSAQADTPSEVATRLVREATARAGTDPILARLPEVQASRRCTESQALTVLGTGYVLANQLEPALFCFARAVVLEPTDVQYLNNLGFVLVDQGRYDDAAVVLEAAYAASPENAEVCMNLGKLCWRRGDKERALTLLAVAAHDDSHPEYPYELAKAQSEAGQAEQAKQTVTANLNQHPTHKPSLALYQRLTGQSWRGPQVCAMAKEAVDYAGEVQVQFRDWARELDKIASLCGDDTKPGTKWATFMLTQSQTYARLVTDTQAVPQAGDDLIAINALMSFVAQIKLLGTAYHQYYPGVYCWQHNSKRPCLKVTFGGGWYFTNEMHALSETFRRFRSVDGRDKGAVEAAARAYLAAMPPGLNDTAATLELALRNMLRFDTALYGKFWDYYERYKSLLVSETARIHRERQPQLVTQFFDTNPGATYGTGWAIKQTQTEWNNFIYHHRLALASAAEILKERAPPVKELPSLADFLRALADGSDGGPLTASLKFNFEVAQISLGSDGKVTLRIGQGAMAAGYYNAFKESWGVKIGAGYDASNPGPVVVGVSDTAFVVWDSVEGLGCEAGVSASAGPGKLGYTSEIWFASLL